MLSRSALSSRPSTSALSCLVCSAPSSQASLRHTRSIPSSSFTSTSANSSSSRRRQYATISSSSGPERNSGVRVGTLFLALSILGLGATSVGLYNYFTSLKTFPEAVRTELRSALRCKARGDYRASDKFYRVAWEKALALQDDAEADLSLLKITGIGIAWAEMLEETGRRADNEIPNARGESYSVLLQTFDWARKRLQEQRGTVEERMRAVAMAVKMASLVEGQNEFEQQSEKQLTWAVEEVLRISTSSEDLPATSAQSEDGILVGELDLPSWVSKADLGGTLESLGNLYARKGNVEYAMPLYLQSISLLMPPPKARKTEPTITEKCHAATIMNNLSSLIASAPAPPSSSISQTVQASAWAGKASQIASAALASANPVNPEADACRPTLVVALYNLGMLKLLEKNEREAKVLLGQAKEKAREWRLKEAEVRASEALRTL